MKIAPSEPFDFLPRDPLISPFSALSPMTKIDAFPRLPRESSLPLVTTRETSRQMFPATRDLRNEETSGRHYRRRSTMTTPSRKKKA